MTQLTIAKCPSCGADLRITGDGTARCSYCQKDIIVRGSQAPVSATAQNLVTLARAATEAGNDEEASALWSRVLEHDPKNAEAWLGKAKAVPMTVGGMLDGYAQAESYCQRAREGDPEVLGEVLLLLASLLDAMTGAAFEAWDDYWSALMNETLHDGPPAGEEGGEFFKRIFFILDARERLAVPGPVPFVGSYEAAIELCDRLLGSSTGKKNPELKGMLLERRAHYLETLGPAGAEQHQAPAATGRSGKLALVGVGVVVVALAAVGYGRWADAPSPKAPSAVAVTTASPAPAVPAMPNDGTDATRSVLPDGDEDFVEERGGAGWGDKCWANIKEGKWGWAKAECDRALDMAPASPQPRASLLFNEGLIAKSAGDTATARSDFQASLALRENAVVRKELQALSPAIARSAPRAPAKVDCAPDCFWNGSCALLRNGSDKRQCCKPVTNSVQGPEFAATCRAQEQAQIKALQAGGQR
jgi:tetratricopeptide (TPR) repeat protein